MARPTKDEAQSWYLRLFSADGGAYVLGPEEASDLRVFLLRVRASLPSAAAVERDRKRRRKEVQRDPVELHDPDYVPGHGDGYPT